MTEKDINRRSFIKRAAAATTLTAAFSGAYLGLKDQGVPLVDEGGTAWTPRRKPAVLPEKPRFGVARGDDPAALVAAAVDAHGGLGGVIKPGDIVLIKPNVGWDRSARLAANTNPLIVRETARLCLEAGAKRVIVSDNPCNNPSRCFDRSGIRKALEDLPVEILVPADRDFVEFDVKGEALGKWPVLRAFLECDRAVNIPVAKHHSSAVLTMGMKNWYGILGGGRKRGQLHQKMAVGIADLAAFARPDLTILDAFRVIFRNGPQGGSLRDTKDLKTVAVSTDPVAVDAFGATLFDLEPRDVPYIPIAESRGLGTSDFASLEPVEREV